MIKTAADNTTPRTRRLALLIASPWPGETAMQEDLVAMYAALRGRGMLPEEILSLSGRLSRTLLLAILEEARRRVTTWDAGELFLYFSGHGSFDCQRRPGLRLRNDFPEPGIDVAWHEVLDALPLRRDIPLVLLPDC
jgi:hypothetical protein